MREKDRNKELPQDHPHRQLTLEDAEMPQLKTLLDPQKMLGVFRNQLHPTGEGHYHIYHISDCKVHRFRYRKGKRVIVQYQLTLHDQLTKHNKKLWITGISRSTPEHMKKLYKRILNSDSWWNISLSTLILEPVLYLPALKLILQTYPQDHHLPTLPLLLNDRLMMREKLLLNPWLKDWKMMENTLTLIRYRPLLGATFRCDFEAEHLRTKENIKKTLYFKVFQKEDGRHIFEQLVQLKKDFPVKEQGLYIVNAITYSKQLKTLVLEAALGIPLSVFILNGVSIEQTLEKTAEALAHFHLSPCALFKHQSKAVRLKDAEKAVRFIREVCPELQEKSRQLFFQIQSRIKDVVLCPTHLDLKPEHIFINGARVTLIDLDAAAMSDPVYDIASLIVRIEFLSEAGQIPQEIVAPALRGLKARYFSKVPYSWKERLIPNYCCAALKIALYHLQHQEKDAKHRVAILLEKCLQYLSKQERQEKS